MSIICYRKCSTACSGHDDGDGDRLVCPEKYAICFSIYLAIFLLENAIIIIFDSVYWKILHTSMPLCRSTTPSKSLKIIKYLLHTEP